MKSMTLKMLQSIAGRDFALSVGEVTDRFPVKEAKRLVSAGMAEVAPPEPVKKPETKQEWDDERDKLLGENAALIAENDALKSRADELQQQIDGLSTFKASVAAALGGNVADQEVAVKPSAPEKRG